LFDRAYQELIGSMGIPCAFVDGYAGANKHVLNCDFITMENVAACRTLTDKMIQAGAKTIGFVGDKSHYNSFYERWCGYLDALFDANLRYYPDYCILHDDGALYSDVDWLAKQISSMPRIPDAFVCANDFIAIHIMAALKKQG